MPATDKITIWHWIGFVAAVVILLGLDLRIFHRRARVVRFKEALLWTAVWFGLAMVFALSLTPLRGERHSSLEFLTGYLIEFSLSMDNMFVIALIFAFFQVPSEHQHRVLFWGILGALAMRGLMIGVGAVLIRWLWILYVFGVLILISGIKMFFFKTEVAPEKNFVVRLARKFFPVAPHFDGEKFCTQWNGRMALTPLALTLVMVETMDLVFAVDSIPAIFAVTRDPFIVFTSNVFAILGLRSLYFVLAGAIGYFRYLKYGLALVLVFIGVKMLIAPHNKEPLWFQRDIPIGVSLITVAGIILISIVLSITASRERMRGQ